MILLLLLLLLLLMLLGFRLFVRKTKDGKNPPPGPWGFPLFGHLPLLVPDPLPVLNKWKKKYGPIISCRFGSFQTVILLDPDVIREAFRMSEISGRPQLRVVQETEINKGLIFSEGSYNTELRQFTFKNFKEFGVGRKNFNVQIQRGVARFLSFIKTVERKPMRSVDIPSSQLIQTLWTVLMSEELSGAETEVFSRILHSEVMNLGSPISELAGFMPWLERLVRSLSFGHCSLMRGRTEGVRKLLAHVKPLVQRKKQTWVKGQDEHEDKDMAEIYFQKEQKTTDLDSCFHPAHNSSTFYIADLFMGGLHTSHTFLLWFLYYVAVYPAVQKELQEEINLVIGPSRLPTLEDRANMPFVEAILFELLRIASISPLLIPRTALEDVRLRGYTIEKGTIIFADGYGVHHDPEIWGDPEKFRPQRWFGESGQGLKRKHYLPFSTGRRRCPASQLVTDQLFLYVTTVCQRYDLELYGENSKRVRGIYGLTRQPSEFQLVFTPLHT